MGDRELYYSLIVMVVILLYTFVKIYGTIRLKRVNFTACKL